MKANHLVHSQPTAQPIVAAPVQVSRRVDAQELFRMCSKYINEIFYVDSNAAVDFERRIDEAVAVDDVENLQLILVSLQAKARMIQTARPPEVA